MSPIPQVADAEAKQAQLTRMKRRATGLLVLMGVVFVIAWSLEPAHAWLGYVRATAEAGLVGGVADWFAITALFRHPLKDRKSTRLNSSHMSISYAVFCLKR